MPLLPRPSGDPWGRVTFAFGILVVVVVSGTLGYVLLGLSLLDAVYQSVTTVTTVGFREVVEPTDSFKVFTIVLVLAGVGSVLYALSVLLDALVEGRFQDRLGRRRVQRRIDDLTDHVIVAGWGRVGKAITSSLAGSGTPVVVIERDEGRFSTVDGLAVQGDATEDDVLRLAGVERARTLVAALDTDADNLYVTLSARQLNASLFIVARARTEGAESKLAQAGADRVVNPQAIGGARMAALVDQPHVADFVDVVMHDAGLEFRLREVTVDVSSPSPAARSGRHSCGTRPAPSSSPCATRAGGSAPTRPPRTRSGRGRCSSPSGRPPSSRPSPGSPVRAREGLDLLWTLTARAGCRRLSFPTSL